MNDTHQQPPPMTVEDRRSRDLIAQKVAEWRENSRRSRSNSDNQRIPELDRRQCFGVSQAYEQCADELEALLGDTPGVVAGASQDLPYTGDLNAEEEEWYLRGWNDHAKRAALLLAGEGRSEQTDDEETRQSSAPLRVVVNGQPVEVASGPVTDVIAQAIQKSGQIGAPVEQWELRTPDGDVIPHDIGGDWHLTGGRLLFLNLGLPPSGHPRAADAEMEIQSHESGTAMTGAHDSSSSSRAPRSREDAPQPDQPKTTAPWPPVADDDMCDEHRSQGGDPDCLDCFRQNYEEIGRALIVAMKRYLPKYTYCSCPTEVIGDLVNEIEDLKASSPLPAPAPAGDEKTE